MNLDSQVYSNDEFDLWPVYSGERFRAFRPLVITKGDNKIYGY